MVSPSSISSQNTRHDPRQMRINPKTFGLLCPAIGVIPDPIRISNEFDMADNSSAQSHSAPQIPPAFSLAKKDRAFQPVKKPTSASSEFDSLPPNAKVRSASLTNFLNVPIIRKMLSDLSKPIPKRVKPIPSGVISMQIQGTERNWTS
jgi:hypothetical protein